MRDTNDFSNEIGQKMRQILGSDKALAHRHRMSENGGESGNGFLSIVKN